MSVKVKTAKEILLGAAQVIRERGHCKRVYMNAEGACCVRGAFGVVRSGDPLEGFEGLSTEDAAEALRRIIGSVGIVDWNDAPERTAAEVIDALERAAEACE